MHDDLNDTTTRHSSLVFLNNGVVSSWRRVRRVSRRLAVAVFVVAASAACVTTKAATPIEHPALEVPPPPPRVITPLPVPDLPAQEVPAEDPNSKPSAPPKPKPQPQANAKPPDSKPPDAPVEAAQPAQPPPVPPPVPTLSTPPQGDANAVARQVRDSITRTRAALDKINYGPLSNDRKKAYDDAKLFATQAEEGLKANNLVFAKELADKAERLAKELQSR
jgi:outer membrane biosynthesis protein TonB